MRVAHYVPHFSPISETFIYDLVVAERRLGTDVHVATQRRVLECERPFDHVHVLDRRSRLDPLRLASVAAELLTGSPLRKAGWTATRNALANVLSELEPDLVHAHFGPAGVLAAPVARRLRLPLIVSFHGADLSAMARLPEWRAEYRELWDFVSAITVVSEWMKQRAIALGCPPEKLCVVHVGCPVAQLAYRRRHSPPRTLMSVGRLVEKKGHLDAIRAVELANESEDVTLTIFGDGPMGCELERYVRAHHLDCVHLAGAAPHADVIRALVGADGVLVCSKTAADGDEEGIPVVLMEAQALGLPCIGTRHAGIPEGVPPENHWLLSAEGDVRAIAATIRKVRGLTADQLGAISQHGRKHVERHFDSASSVQQVLGIYEATMK